MYYRIKVFSSIYEAEQEVILYKDDDPCLTKEDVEEFVSKATPYKVNVTMCKHKAHRRVFDSCVKLYKYVSNLRFYKGHWEDVEDWKRVATFYTGNSAFFSDEPFSIETDCFNNQWYSFFKRPNKYITDLYSTITDCGIGYPRITKNGDPYLFGKYRWLYSDKEVHLEKLEGTHIEYSEEYLVM